MIKILVVALLLTGCTATKLRRPPPDFVIVNPNIRKNISAIMKKQSEKLIMQNMYCALMFSGDVEGCMELFGWRKT